MEEETDQTLLNASSASGISHISHAVETVLQFLTFTKVWEQLLNNYCQHLNLLTT